MAKMNPIEKNETLIRKIETYLRKITRQLIHIDTEEETIQYFIDSFTEQINCHFVGVVLVENNRLVLKAWGGNIEQLDRLFPLPVNEYTERFLLQSLKDEDAYKFKQCPITKGLKHSAVKTWFTVPLINGDIKYGFCIVGYYTKVPLYEMYHIFDEFGKDVAAAISLIRRKERSMWRLEEIEWIKKFSIDKTLEENVKQFTLLASKGLNAQAACFYLLDDKNKQFQLMYPVYGEVQFPERIEIKDNNNLINYFPHLEEIGTRKLTMPIVIELKTVGVLHIERTEDKPAFTLSDRRMLRLLADYIAVVQENRQIYMNEKEQRERLQLLLDYQQALVKQTVLDDDFKVISTILTDIFDCTVILLDRFARPITTKIHRKDEEKLDFLKKGYEDENLLDKLKAIEYVFTSWPISGVNSRLGYLVLGIEQIDLDDFDILAVNVARNICSIQFIKQKLVFDANEQVKEALMMKLFVDEIEDESAIIQYANLFQWDIFAAHRVTSISFQLEETEKEKMDILELKMTKQYLWDHIMEHIKNRYRRILTATYEDHFLLIVPTKELEKEHHFWEQFYKHIKEAVNKSGVNCEVFLGIGNETTGISSYQTSYRQSVQALNVVKNRFRTKGYALFEQLGSYTILNQLSHSVVDVFIQDQLGKLIEYSKENDINLVETLRTYLQNNGNAKSTAQQLYIHRSSLLYRLERIENLLGIDLNDFETRFDLTLALKLLDMHGTIEG